jgi:transcriptional regulator with XRE-family HTH domain
MTKAMSPSLAIFIRERRQDLGLTQEQLGERVGDGVRQSEISRLEKGTVSMPHPDRLIALARALDVPFGELLLRTGLIEAYQRDQIDRLASQLLSENSAIHSAIEDLSKVLTVLAEGRADVLEADRKMAQAELMILSVLTRLKRDAYSDIRTPIGAIKRWETTGLTFAV